ncbi:excinuclease ABC subunit A [Candidatus Roizmanbacteria bacterium RIFCSPHIGHO2_12_FULL_41_11]|uniref:UvrABC system protein A n=1 Tax=Candidatus Roizmanbacteria bacterium RIFCSPHIGHO2_12_FULL_41_11 TaxID=1802052 RepID=A0A1F7I5R3_9BACT|nr:MAG: excinuclease ABC subunit A [Candidatus Roizmanbacteria bacterium RIFCSPHIGHO2_12_FULL_41_11]
MLDSIKVKGARQHNLKNLSVDIPKNKFVVFTGVSGSGKSSLAFDTIYAEGQRRYVESLSAYARQFLGIMDKPDVDLIEGLSPSISIDQKTVSHNPRSTVGTITEVYDFLRVLFARIGHPHCPNCHIEISKLSIDEMVGKINILVAKTIASNKISPHEFVLLSPIVRAKKGEFKDLFNNLQSKGYSEVVIDGKTMSTADEINLIKANKHTISVVIDHFFVSYTDFKNVLYQSNLKSRLNNLVEQAANLSDGLIILKAATEEYLFSEKFSCPNCNLSLPEIEPRMFSFNSPLGACEKCKGIGTLLKFDKNLAINPKLSVNEGGIVPFSQFFYQDTWYIRLLKQMAKEEGIDLNIPIGKFAEDKKNLIFNGSNKIYRVPGTNRQGRPTTIYERFEGIATELERRFYDSSSEWVSTELQKYMREEICGHCDGAKLKPEVLSITIEQQNISRVCDWSVEQIIEYYEKSLLSKLKEYERQIATPILKEINTRLKFLKNVGLGYLTVSRAAKTLSGGELQRIRLASQIGTGLTGVLYVLDEPSIGLHPRDVDALIDTLHNLKNLGNTLIVVEHDQETIQSADYVVELGPQAGKNGGQVVFTGTVGEMAKASHSLTGQYISGKKKIAIKERDLTINRGKINLIGAKQFNLKNLDIELPLGNLIAVTGVSGSGKSTLISETLYPALKYYLDGFWNESMGDYQRLEGYHFLDRVYLVDQSPIGRTPRSNPATYIGFFNEIRDIYAATIEAKAQGYQKGRFSFNVKGGRCEKCQGAGVIKIEMQFLSDVYVTCDVCEGKRYNRETLEVRFKDKTIYDILNMTVDEAVDFFKNHQRIFHKLLFLQEVGLGYIELGQRAPTFSGGEAQRIKLANELSRRDTGKTLYILDEPTTGLHFYDVQKLLTALFQLVNRGNTVIVIEHNLDVIKNSQYIIDLGPEGGDRGGKIIYQGKTKDILKVPASYTGQYLKHVID